MFDLESASFADQIRRSDDYKMVQDKRRIYIFPADADFERLVQNRGMLMWEHTANIIIDETGRVVKNRYGRISE